MSDYDWIGPLVGGVAKGINSYGTATTANAQMQAAYDQMLKNLQDRFGDYDKLGSAGYKDIAAQQLGPSALAGIQNDAQARADEQASQAALQQLADNGGLSLADMAALNKIQGNLNMNNSARRQGLANQYAARGQLGSGAQLSMDLANQQNAAQNANEAGESAAAQAQARALNAILQKGQMARSMSNDDYQRKAQAAQAADAISARNAAARTDASKYNNSLAGQNFEDQLKKAQGKTSLTNGMNQAVLGKGVANRNTTQGIGEGINSGINSVVGGFGSMSGSNNGSSSGGSTGSISDPNGGGDTTGDSLGMDNEEGEGGF